ncbi:MAG: hypothetical protein ABL925_06265 [Methylococcales bacterium]
MNLQKSLLTTALFAVLSVNAQAGFVADGDLKDWLAAPTGTGNDWLPSDSSVKYTIEDQSGLENDGFLNPGLGGQAYDAEAIYLKQTANFFYVAVVTGLSPKTIDYPAGDLAFDFGNDGSYEYGVVVKSDSHNTNVNSAENGGIGSKGDVYKVSKWNVGLWADDDSHTGIGQGTQAHPTTVNAGNKLGKVELVYKEAFYDGSKLLSQLGSYKGSHYVIEAKIPTFLFATTDLAKAFTVHWTMACANDAIDVDPPASQVPSPTTLPLLALGLTMLLGFSRKLNLLTPNNIN